MNASHKYKNRRYVAGLDGRVYFKEGKTYLLNMMISRYPTLPITNGKKDAVVQQ